MKRRNIKRVTRHQVPIERFQVTGIEDNAMPLGNGPLVKRIGAHQPEQFVGLLAGLAESVAKVSGGPHKPPFQSSSGWEPVSLPSSRSGYFSHTRLVTVLTQNLDRAIHRFGQHVKKSTGAHGSEND